MKSEEFSDFIHDFFMWENEKRKANLKKAIEKRCKIKQVPCCWLVNS